MPFSSTLSPLPPVFLSSSFCFKPSVMLPRRELLKSRKNSFYLLPSRSSLFSEQAVLGEIAEFDMNTLPAIRSYENDLARLTVVGAVDFEQALTAAAADGGEAADEHISSGTATMVVETIFPGPADKNSTISTRLFLPTGKVKEKARKLKKSLAKDILSSTSSKNILAMTFRQVVLRRLWNVKLELFISGSERDMNNLENPREISGLLTLSSADKQVISVISEVICIAALENTEKNYLNASANRTSYNIFPWIKKRRQISSKDSSTVLYNLFDHEILKNAKILLEKFNLERAKYKIKDTKLKNNCWRLPEFSKLEKIGGPEFCDWISECIPFYILKIDARRFNNVEFEGWKNSRAAVWELILTHAQMISLADTLDMYYEDLFTLPNERLSCSTVAKSSQLALTKGSSMLMKFYIAVASCIFLAVIGVGVKFCLPYLPIKNSYSAESSPFHSADISLVPQYSMEHSKAEAACVSMISRIKNYYGWPGEINKMNHGHGACVGELPVCLKNVDGDINKNSKSSAFTAAESDDEEMKALQNIASYQIVLSSEENILGFQPTNRVAVNNWALNPLAKDLYSGKSLSPGLFEPALKISRPRDILILDLLMSINPESSFAFVRTVDISEHFNAR